MFSMVNTKSLTTLKNAIDEFTPFSGLQVNGGKSAMILYVSHGVEQDELCGILRYIHKGIYHLNTWRFL